MISHQFRTQTVLEEQQFFTNIYYIAYKARITFRDKGTRYPFKK